MSSQLRDGLRRIVETEGPVIGNRLYHLYVKSSGGHRVTSNARRRLNRVVAAIVNDGTLLAEDPLNVGGQIPKTYRTPGQPPIVVRERGDRTIHQIPPNELAARLRALRQEGDSADGTYRRLLAAYDLVRLTAATRETLEQANTLLEPKQLD